MSRFRLSATIRPSTTIRFFVQAQDSRAFDKTTGGQVAPMRDTFDLRQAYGDFGPSRATVRIGRQDLFFGEQRLIGNLPWTNTARSFDGGRVTLRQKIGQFDVFAASVVNIQPEAFDKSGNGNILYGTYESLTNLIPKQTIEPYFLWRQSRGIAAELGGTATLHQATTGVRMAGALPHAFDYSTEAALQRGSAGPDDIRAWAGHGARRPRRRRRARTPAAVRRVQSRVGRRELERRHARHLRSALSHRSRQATGSSDQVGWRNINHARAGARPQAGGTAGS